MKCPNCGTENQDSYKFCMVCGNALIPAKPSQPTPLEKEELPREDEVISGSKPEQVIPQDEPEPIDSKLTPQNQSQAQTPQHSPDTPAQAVQRSAQWSPAQDDALSAQSQPQSWVQPQTSWGLPSANVQSQPTPSQSQVPQAFPTGYGEAGTSIFSIWGPFAGYGTRRRHIGWLMEGQGSRAGELKPMVESHLKQRETPGRLEAKELYAQGLFNQRRPYFLMRKGLITVGLYISEFGRDLFVSMVSYLKPPISWFRVLILSVMILFHLFMMFGFRAALADSLGGFTDIFGGGPDFGSLMNLICLVGPLGTLNAILLAIFLVYSLYKFIKERDILAGLRMAPNEFDEDDLMALEKAVDEVVRQSLTELKLNPDDLKLTFSQVGGQLF